ncbi:MAG: hypothetical protein ACPIOQ_52185 [Promethearchaeia archaeon]
MLSSACCRADIWFEQQSDLPARGQSGRWYERHDPHGGGDEEQCYDWPCPHPPALPRGFAGSIDDLTWIIPLEFAVTSPEAAGTRALAKASGRSEKDGMADARTYEERQPWYARQTSRVHACGVPAHDKSTWVWAVVSVSFQCLSAGLTTCSYSTL